MNFFKRLLAGNKKESITFTNDQTPSDIVNQITSVILSDKSFDEIASITGENKVDIRVLQKSFENVIDVFLEDNVLSNEEEERIVEFIEYFGLKQQDLDSNGSYTKIGQSKILRQVLNGEMPNVAKIEPGILPFNLTKGETIIWLFYNVKYHEDTIKRSYEGGSRGASVRVAKGVYLRGGSYRGKVVESNYLKLIGVGMMAITNKNIYYASNQKTFKLPHQKIVGVKPYSDGIQIFKDGVNAKAQYFTQIDGLFAYNLISNINLL